MINRKSPIPLYIQLADILREQIKSGEIKPGSKLPSETEMINRYNLSRLTIRDALSVLVNEGLLEKHHGKGTFCKSDSLNARYKIDVLLNLTDVYFIPNYLRSICTVLENSGASAVLSDTKNDSENICLLLEKIMAEGSDGILIQPAFDADYPPKRLLEIFERLGACGIPYIMIDSSYKGAPKSYAVMDEEAAGVMAAEHFKALGHTSLCMIALKGYADSEGRMRGFAGALENPPARIDYSANFADCLAELLTARPDITGIFCYNDEIAKECYAALDALSLLVPEDISVISVDDTVIAETLTPPLTSIIHPKELLGSDSANALISIISGKTSWPYKKIFKPSINIRRSCKKTD